jgi:hypothetical protein
MSQKLSILPLEILQIICDYLPDNSLPDIDISEQVEKIFGPEFGKQLSQCEKYDQCFCQKLTACHCAEFQQLLKCYRYFCFHPGYPEKFLEKILDSKNFTEKNFPNFSSSSTLTSERKPFFINVKKRTQEFLKKYLPQSTKMAAKRKEEKDTTARYRITSVNFKEYAFIDDMKEIEKLNKDSGKKIEEFITENLTTINSLPRRNLVWRHVLRNEKISFQFLLHHLREGNIRGEKTLPTLCKHPTFLNNWSTHYSRFYSAQEVDRTFSRFHQNSDYVGEDFFKQFPKFLTANLNRAVVSADFLRQHCKDNNLDLSIFLKPYVNRMRAQGRRQNGQVEKDGDYIARKYGLFENKNVGEEFIEEVLAFIVNEKEKEKSEQKIRKGNEEPKEEKEEKEEIENRPTNTGGNIAAILKTLNTNHSLSSKFWERHPEWIYWGTESYFHEKTDPPTSRVSTISRNPNLSINFIKKHKDRLNLVYVFRYNNLLPVYLMRQALAKFLENDQQTEKQENKSEKNEKKRKLEEPSFRVTRSIKKKMDELENLKLKNFS